NMPRAVPPRMRSTARHPMKGFLITLARNARPKAIRMTGQKRRSRRGVSGCAHPTRTARRRTPIARSSAPRAILPKFIREAVPRAPYARKRRPCWKVAGGGFLGLEKWGCWLDSRGLHGPYRCSHDSGGPFQQEGGGAHG